MACRKQPCLPLLLLLVCVNVAFAALPLVDFDRMGKVGLAGAFAGFDLFNDSSKSIAFDSSTSTLLSRSSDGALTRIAATNSGGKITAGCAIDDVFYFAGLFSAVDNVTIANVASYTTSSNTIVGLGSGGPNGEVDALYCDDSNKKLWVGGRFTSPGSAVAIWDTKASTWSKPPFNGFSGANKQVTSITSNSSGSSLFFAGSFIASFQGNGSSVLNGTNNPNVPFSTGASPFSSSLVPVPLSNVEVTGSPSTSESGFSDIKTILCPSGNDGSGSTWFAADGNAAVITVRTFTSLMSSGVRLGNTFLGSHSTTGFSITTIPDNTVRTLRYLDPSSGQNKTCTNSCPLATDSSVLYQDFLFDGALSITGVQIKLSEWSGSAPGLHILQLLSSGAFASAVNDQNGQSCFSPAASNTTHTGDWTAKVANTDISGTTQTVLVSTVDISTSASAGPSLTWMPYISASGDYDVNLLVPGCTNFQDCDLRTSVKVTVFPGGGLQPSVQEISQTNKEDAVHRIYSGPILPTSPEFVATITMTLADSPEGSGQGGKYELVADRVQLVLTSANATSDGSSNGTNTSSSASQNLFGFFEWPLSSSSTSDATQTLPNNTLSGLDTVGADLFKALGLTSSSASTNAAIATVAHHSSGTIFIGGNFTLTSGAASKSANIVSFKNGALAGLADGGLNGPVTSLVVEGDKLFVGGSFKDTTGGSQQGKLGGVAIYNVAQNTWSSMQAGVDGAVSNLGLFDNKVQVVGNFTKLLSSSGSGLGTNVGGLASWDINSGTWVNSGGFLVGSLLLVTNGTSSTQFIAGSVTASQKYGANGLVMLENGDDNGPTITPLSARLDGVATAGSGSSTNKLRRSLHFRPGKFMSSVTLSHIFSRQSSGNNLAALPALPPAPAPAVLTGAFWSNGSSSSEVVIVGGNFSFSTNSGISQGVAIYDADASSVSGLSGSQINGTVRSLLVLDNKLYVGGQFTLEGNDANGFAIYDLAKQQWETGASALQPSSGSSVLVRSITISPSSSDKVVVAGTFAQAGSINCRSICSLDVASKQWSVLGNGIQGEVSSVSFAGSDNELLIIGGSLSLPDNTGANVAQYSFSNSSWTAVGDSSQIPGVVTALEVNGGNASSIFAAGRSTDGSSPFLTFWNGASWVEHSNTLQGNTTIAQLAMVPLQNSHDATGVIEQDRMLMISGSLLDSSFGEASSALYDGKTFSPYIVSTSSDGNAGYISSLFHSFSTFSFTKRHFLATGIVILISIAIAAGVVFLLALIGIIWTLFSRRDDKISPADDIDDDDSVHHRPSSLLEHINAATRTTILGGAASTSPFGNFGSEKEEERITRDEHAYPPPEQDPFGADNYARPETPSDIMGGGMMTDEQSRPGHVRYSFDGQGEGELPLTAGAEIDILDDRDHAWWYARDPRTGREGVVPAAYLY